MTRALLFAGAAALLIVAALAWAAVVSEDWMEDVE